MVNEATQSQQIGIRAERVASWYFRLNGFLSIPGLIIHRDSQQAELNREGRREVAARTDVDLLAVRFPYSREVVASKPMEDIFTAKAIDPASAAKVLFVLVEVAAGTCKMNGPWTSPEAKNMQRVVRRMGFAKSADEVEAVAAALYQNAQWIGPNHLVQYVSVGKDSSIELEQRFPLLRQVVWDEIGAFLFDRFSAHPEKTPSGHVHRNWPDFGRSFGDWFVRARSVRSRRSAADAVRRYIVNGSCMPLTD